jgi:hypothetical protein
MAWKRVINIPLSNFPGNGFSGADVVRRFKSEPPGTHISLAFSV